MYHPHLKPIYLVILIFIRLFFSSLATFDLSVLGQRRRVRKVFMTYIETDIKQCSKLKFKFPLWDWTTCSSDFESCTLEEVHCLWHFRWRATVALISVTMALLYILITAPAVLWGFKNCIFRFFRQFFSIWIPNSLNSQLINKLSCTVNRSCYDHAHTVRLI